jgi:hypothetical protein
MRLPVLLLLTLLTTAIPATGQDACFWLRDLCLIKRKIH